ncbi:MAG: PqqD family protein [Pseudomonadota bacterium]
MHFVHNGAEIASEQFDDGVVIINFLTGRYYTLNASAEWIWTNLETATTSSQLYAAFPSEPSNEITDHIDGFVITLLEFRLIAPSRERGDPDKAIAAPPDPFVEPQIEAFEDLSELITLDPIHEVNKELGWPIMPPDEKGSAQ